MDFEVNDQPCSFTYDPDKTGTASLLGVNYALANIESRWTPGKAGNLVTAGIISGNGLSFSLQMERMDQKISWTIDTNPIIEGTMSHEGWQELESFFQHISQ